MKAPHLIPYQGSKRRIAEQILSHIQHEVEGKIYEPFAGSAAITLAAAVRGIGKGFVIGDKYDPLVELWKLIINDPKRLSKSYENIWKEQFDEPKLHFVTIREEFNSTKDPARLLYLIARCVKNSIRFNADGKFNQSADNRRSGMKPEKVAIESSSISKLLKDRVEIVSGDFMEIVDTATSNDFIYMDPPWRGTSKSRDPRYAFLLDEERLFSGLRQLNERNVPYLLSFDGTSGGKEYGDALPSALNLERVSINAGRSSQATLLGRDDITIESLYLSPALIEKNNCSFSYDKQSKMFG